MKCFVQSYENQTILDSSILIAPLVFFIAPNDPPPACKQTASSPFPGTGRSLSPSPRYSQGAGSPLLDELLNYLLHHGGSVGILDATNSNGHRRKLIVVHGQQRETGE